MYSFASHGLIICCWCIEDTRKTALDRVISCEKRIIKKTFTYSLLLSSIIVPRPDG